MQILSTMSHRFENNRAYNILLVKVHITLGIYIFTTIVLILDSMFLPVIDVVFAAILFIDWSVIVCVHHPVKDEVAQHVNIYISEWGLGSMILAEADNLSTPKIDVQRSQYSDLYFYPTY